MENRIIFREMLTEIKKAADASGNRISRDKVRELLAGLPLEEEHLELVYEYLAQQNIRVTDGQEEPETGPVEGQESLSLYIDELIRMEQEMPGEEQQLMRRVMEGDETARDQMIRQYLPVICAKAQEYQESHLPLEDLIQEGNLALLTAMASLEKYDSPAACRAHIFNSVGRAMEQAVEDSRKGHEMDQGIVSRVNHLHEAVKNLERDLEHKVSPEELSAYLEMPLEEIQDILRMSGDQIDINKK